jgi:hypothetical protein
MANKRKQTPVDDPFQDRAEDYLNKGIRAGVGALPVIGSSLTEFLPFVVGDPAQERRDDFMKATLQRVVDLEDQFEQLSKEALRDDAQFQATFIQATRLSTQSASSEKRKLLQNAIVNSAILDIEDNHRQILMQFLERITPLHAAVLNLFDDPQANENVRKMASRSIGGLTLIVDAAIPELQGRRAIADRVVSDLESMGLLNGANLNITNDGIRASRFEVDAFR